MALGVGAAQALSLMPGVSSSGVTITASRFLKLDRDDAARLSFFLLIPIVFGAVLYKGLGRRLRGPALGLGGPLRRRHDRRGGGRPDRDRTPARLRAQHDYSIFVVYRLCLAAAISVIIATGVGGHLLS